MTSCPRPSNTRAIHSASVPDSSNIRACARSRKVASSRSGWVRTRVSHIERGLRLVLARRRGNGRRARVTLPVSRATGGTHPAVDLNDSRAVMDLSTDVRDSSRRQRPAVRLSPRRRAARQLSLVPRARRQRRRHLWYLASRLASVIRIGGRVSVWLSACR